MRIFRDTTGRPGSVRGATVTIGNFDGVHRGHQAVIGEARRIARAAGGPLAVITFEPHPRRFFRPDMPTFELTPLRSKARWLAALGVEYLQLVHFDEAFSRNSAEAFVDDLLVDGLAARHVVVGYDFVFGNARRGTVDMLRAVSDEGRFGFTAVGPVKDGDGPVYSSTSIRQFLAEGAPGRAAELLGRCWEVEGRVRHGDRRGRQIGFPTANLSIDGYLEPALGVYAVWAGLERDGGTEWHMGCANIGRRPTFDGEGVTVEVNIFDFADDIYDRPFRAALVDYIRPERKFAGVDELRQQIAADCAAARTLLGGIPPGDLRGPPDDAMPAPESEATSAT